MAFALVGTIGTAVQSTSGGNASPTFGASETRAFGNLLICFTSVTGTATLPATPSGWSIAKQLAGTSCSATVYYKSAAGSDAAPVITGVTSGLIAAQLAEFSGASGTPLDQTGSAAATSSPVTATFGGADKATTDLFVAATGDFRSVARSPTDTITSNHATITQAGNNNLTSSVNHYSFGYATSTSSIVGADTAIMTPSVTTSITGLVVAAATFKVPGANASSTVTGSLSFVGAIPKITNAIKSAAASFRGAFIYPWRQVGSLSFSGAVTRIHIFGAALTGALSFVGSITKKTSRLFTASLSFVGAIQKFLNIVSARFTGTLSFGATPSTLLNGLQVYYALEDLTESSGTGLTLTNVNGVTFVTGKVNNAANFVAASFQALTHVDAAQFQPGTGNWTVAVWVKTTSAGNAIFEYGKVVNGAANPGYNLRLVSGAPLATMADGTNLAFKTSSTTINDGAYHLVIATFDRSSNISVYVDAGAAQTASLTAVTGSANDTQGWGFSIGKNVNGDWIDAGIDEFGMWNRVLTSGERTTLWNSSAGTTYPFPSGGGGNVFLKQINKALAATLSFIGSLIRRTAYLITGALSFRGNFIYPWRQSGTLSFVGSVTKQTQKLLTATLSFIGSIATSLIHSGTVFHEVLIATLDFAIGISDSYSGSNDLVFSLDSDPLDNQGVGQAFTSTGGQLVAASFFAGLSGAGATGNATAKLYAVSGTFGTNAIPSGAALATSDNLDVTTFTSTQTWGRFTFSGANRYVMSAGTNYFISVEYSGGDASNAVIIGSDTSSPTHAGNLGRYKSGSWAGDSAKDCLFYVYAYGLGTSLTKSTLRIISGALTFIGAIPRQILASKSGTLSFVGVATKRTAATKSGTLSFTGAILRYISRTLSGAVSFIGALTRSISYPLTATLSFSGSLLRSIARALAGTLSFIGSITASHTVIKLLTGTLSFVGSITRSISYLMTAAVSFIGTLLRSIARNLSGTLSFVGSLIKSTSRTMTAVLSFIGSLLTGTLDHLMLTASLAFSGSVIKRTSYIMSGALSFVGSLLRSIAHNLSGTLSFIGSITKSVLKTIAGTLSFVGTLATSAVEHLLLTAALSFSGAITKSTSHMMSGAVSFIGSITRFVAKFLSGTTSFSGSTLKNTQTSRSATLSFIGSLNNRISALKTATLSFVGSITKQINKLLAASASFVGVIRKIPAKALSGTISFAGATTRFISYHLRSVLDFVGDFSRSSAGHFFTTLSASLDFVGSIRRSTSHHMSGSLTFIGAMAKRIPELLSAALSFNGSIIKSTRKTFAAILSFIGSLTPGNITYRELLTAILNFTGSIRKQTYRTFYAILNPIGTITKMVQVITSATLSFIGALSKPINKLFSAVVGFTGTIQKTIYRIVSATLGFIGSLIIFVPTRFMMTLTATLNFASFLSARIPEVIKIAVDSVTQVIQISLNSTTQVIKVAVDSSIQIIKTAVTSTTQIIKIVVKAIVDSFNIHS